ncbi:MAG: tyrosine-type recombinase/integrase [Candidatus Latescibacterota bacterium]|nr:MAG: tyrosine-type recombinase/integrase [Candidatus Latescibacterota bacterium]
MKPISRVQANDLRGYRLWLEKRGLSPQTVVHVLADACCVFNWAVDSGFIDKSPFPRRLKPKIQEKPPKRLSDDDVAKLLALPESYGFTIRLALATGMRWGELTRARADHLQDTMLVVSETKSRKVRRVPLAHEPELLREVRSRVGRLVPFADANAFARRVRSMTGIAVFHVHMLRHTAACHWLERGGSLAALQQVLGHASIVTTQRYARLMDTHVAAEAARLAGRFVEDSVKVV